MKRFIYCIIAVLFFVSVPAFSQASLRKLVRDDFQESWRIFQKAKDEYKKGNYGESIKLAQDAKEARRNESEKNDRILTRALDSVEVRREGDEIPAVLKILEKREEKEVCNLINLLVSKKGADFFNNSISNLHEYLVKLRSYPEADFLLAKIYRLEGEYDLSMDYLENARVSSGILDVPSEKYDILYEMADLAGIQKNMQVYEKTLLLIVEGDGFYKDSTLHRAFLRTMNVKRSDNADRFFMLYRADALNSMKAYNLLSNFYKDSGKKKDALLMNALGTLTGFTHVLSILQSRDPEYSYTTITGFFEECRRYEDICRWCTENSVWKSFYDFADKSFDSSYEYFSVLLLDVLKSECPEQYWANCAKEKLEQISLIEKPDSN